jgi:tRNA modification GTPase
MKFINDTICAITTASGMGAIAVIRVSGTEAFPICDKFFQAASASKSLVQAASHTALFGRIIENENVVDEVLCTVFKTPNSFTGEDTVEISCHGSVYIQQKIIRMLLNAGCRMAEPGEFSRRAFQNNKMDLSQAEAIADLIASTTSANHKLAMQQMRGGFSKELSHLRNLLLQFVTLIELELDFSEEEVEFADRKKLRALTNEMSAHLKRLVQSFQVGNAIKDGIPVAIVGDTNAGKSTLLNCLLNEEKAIVSDIHGTTRDSIEDTTTMGGILFRFIDTAGLRHTQDTIEQMGIDRSIQMMEKAAIILWVIDATRAQQNDWIEEKIQSFSSDKKILMVFNKMDQVTAETRASLEEKYAHINGKKIHISAKKGENVEELKTTLIDLVGFSELEHQDVVVTNLRHYDMLSKAYDAISRVQDGLDNQLSGDFLSQDIRECLHYLGQITGQITSDEVLHNIFKHFCIGK